MAYDLPPRQLGELDPTAPLVDPAVQAERDKEGNKAIVMTVIGVSLFAAMFGGLLYFVHKHPELSHTRAARVGVGKGGWFAGYEFGQYAGNRKVGYQIRTRASLYGEERLVGEPILSKAEAIKKAARLHESGYYQRVSIVDRSTGREFWERWGQTKDW